MTLSKVDARRKEASAVMVDIFNNVDLAWEVGIVGSPSSHVMEDIHQGVLIPNVRIGRCGGYGMAVAIPEQGVSVADAYDELCGHDDIVETHGALTVLWWPCTVVAREARIEAMKALGKPVDPKYGWGDDLWLYPDIPRVAERLAEWIFE